MWHETHWIIRKTGNSSSIGGAFGAGGERCHRGFMSGGVRPVLVFSMEDGAGRRGRRSATSPLPRTQALPSWKRAGSWCNRWSGGHGHDWGDTSRSIFLGPSRPLLGHLAHYPFFQTAAAGSLVRPVFQKRQSPTFKDFIAHLRQTCGGTRT